MDTIFSNEMYIDKGGFLKILNDRMLTQLSDYIEEASNLLYDELMDLRSNNVVLHMLNQKCCIVPEVSLLLPDPEGMIQQTVNDMSNHEISEYVANAAIIDGLTLSSLPRLSELKEIPMLYDDLANIASEKLGFLCWGNNRHFKELFVYKPRDEEKSDRFRAPKSRKQQEDNNIFVFPVHRLVSKTPLQLLKFYLFPYHLCPAELSQEAQEAFEDLYLMYTSGGFLVFDSDDRLVCDIDKARIVLNNDTDAQLFKKLHWPEKEKINEYLCTRRMDSVQTDYVQKLLNCEKIRADIEPYEEKLLSDPNRGHWDLWKDEGQEYIIELNQKLVARNPAADVNENGVIAIDFGTKSTIVVYQSDIEHSLPMGIGDGKLNKGLSKKRYENPTVMHLVRPEAFLQAYHQKEGRPETVWEDLTISHTAMEQFSLSKSEEYYEYLHQIKQWAGQREKQFRIRPHEGESIVLPAFLDIGEEDFNPIEIYAYYIGLYINNMRKGHGIFLDYYLSFPVTYETAVREKILKSFERGLKKSLPPSILHDPQMMERFHVNGQVSEPAAYAVCALQEYGFEPEDDEEIFYGIFDFGGGTTDFDFGIWRQSSKRKYDYTIEHFGAGGDEYLGGENLLEMLAFEVFKDNQTLLLAQGFSFTLAPKCKEFAGSDALLADSQEAEKNMHNLMEKLRPYWEQEQPEIEDNDFNLANLEAQAAKLELDYRKSAYLDQVCERLQDIISDYQNDFCDLETALELLRDIYEDYPLSNAEASTGASDTVTVTLFDKEGKDHPDVKLAIDEKKIAQMIEDRIRDGVVNFFSSLLLSYQNGRVKKSDKIHILLAGNSCKSPVVRKVFEEEIKKHSSQIREKFGIEDQTESFFEIFPPLGTPEAAAKMEERGIEPALDDFERPTGKTGVAFGLIQCRQGGTIERISQISAQEEIPFQFFIGWRMKKKFVVFKDEQKTMQYLGKPDYDEWYCFIEADEPMFELYYTTLPECVGGGLAADGNAAVKRLRCRLDVTDDAAFVYLKAVGPHTIEYVTAKEDPAKGGMLGKVQTRELE